MTPTSGPGNVIIQLLSMEELLVQEMTQKVKSLQVVSNIFILNHFTKIHKPQIHQRSFGLEDLSYMAFY